jgi:hypothetical protein
MWSAQGHQSKIEGFTQRKIYYSLTAILYNSDNNMVLSEREVIGVDIHKQRLLISFHIQNFSSIRSRNVKLKLIDTTLYLTNRDPRLQLQIKYGNNSEMFTFKTNDTTSSRFGIIDVKHLYDPIDIYAVY